MAKSEEILHPAVEAFIRALAREAARRDHFEETEPEPQPARHKSRVKAVIVVPDGQGGYKEAIRDEKQFKLFLEQASKVAEDMRAGRDDALGIRKALRERDAKRRRGRQP